MAFTHHHWPSKVANIIVYLTILGGNFYTIFKGGDEDTSPRQSYITPAPFTFYIWTLIHLLFSGLMVFQWFTDVVHDTVGWHFVTSSLFYGAWLALWISNHTFFSLLALFFATGAVSYVYIRLKSNVADTFGEIFFLHLPFSLYHAWVFVLLIINIFALFTNVDDDGPNVFETVISIFGLFLVAVTVVGYIEHKRGDIAGAVVLAWYLFGVFAAQSDPYIHWSALGFGVCVSFYTLKPLLLRVFGRHSPETAPLLV